jgi:hypothetical protein
VIILRHGERIDKTGLKPQLHISDPELTEKGLKQAYETGELIRTYLYDELNIKKDSKIAIITSPFARTLQTSIKLKEGLFQSDHKDIPIIIDNRVAEYIKEGDFDSHPASFLTIYNNQADPILSKHLEGVKVEYLNTKDHLPLYIEEEEQCMERLIQSLYWNVNKFFAEEDYDVIIKISHATPIDLLNIHMGYPGPIGWYNIQYCSSFIYSYDLENNKFTFKNKIVPNLSQKNKL